MLIFLPLPLVVCPRRAGPILPGRKKRRDRKTRPEPAFAARSRRVLMCFFLRAAPRRPLRFRGEISRAERFQSGEARASHRESGAATCCTPVQPSPGGKEACRSSSASAPRLYVQCSCSRRTFLPPHGRSRRSQRCIGPVQRPAPQRCLSQPHPPNIPVANRYVGRAENRTGKGMEAPAPVRSHLFTRVNGRAESAKKRRKVQRVFPLPVSKNALILKAVGVLRRNSAENGQRHSRDI